MSIPDEGLLETVLPQCHIPPPHSPTAKHPVLLSVEGQERQRVMGSILNTTTQLGLHESREEKARKRGGKIQKTKEIE